MMNNIPQEARRAKRRRLAKSHKRITVEEFRQEYVVWIAPWDTDPMVFDTARKARRFRRRHRREIEDNFDF